MRTLWRYLLQALQAPLAAQVTRVVNRGLGPAGTVLLQLRLDPRVPEAQVDGDLLAHARQDSDQHANAACGRQQRGTPGNLQAILRGS